MECPFLERTRVKFCSLYNTKLIPVGDTKSADERCSGSSWIHCPLLNAAPGLDGSAGRCPFLREECAQFCSLAPVKKLVLCREGERSRCVSDCHQFCPVYLSHAEPDTPARDSEGSNGSAPKIRELSSHCLPEARTDLLYSSNHLWISLADNGICHIGGDAFMARVFGHVEGIHFALHNRNLKPVIRFRIQNLDFDVQFPRNIQTTAFNTALGRDPKIWTADPYGRGWFLQGCLPDGQNRPDPKWLEGLLSGDRAPDWFRCESNRLKQAVHEQGLQSDRLGTLMNDGGDLSPDFASWLPQSAMIQLFAEFFCLLQ